jgi:hypothetical protein
MKSGKGLQIILLFLILVIASFDRHVSYYFSGEVKAIIHADAVPAHSDLPVKSCDYHEDITIKTIFCVIPTPMETPLHKFRIFHSPIRHISPHTVWQPPESNT